MESSLIAKGEIIGSDVSVVAMAGAVVWTVKEFEVSGGGTLGFEGHSCAVKSSVGISRDSLVPMSNSGGEAPVVLCGVIR